MDWNDLRYFLAVAQGGSLSSAAQQLGVSVSTVSRRIDTLEQSLKLRLFRPHRDGYDLTPDGQGLLPAAEQAAAEMRHFERKAKGADGRATPVRIDAPELIAQDLLMPAIAAFMQDHPGNPHRTARFGAAYSPRVPGGRLDLAAGPPREGKLPDTENRSGHVWPLRLDGARRHRRKP